MTPQDSYDKIDRFLRNNLSDDDYTEYSEALETMYCSNNADSKRLNFMQTDGKTHVFSLINDWYTRPAWNMPYKRHNTLRQAIDSAMKDKERKDRTIAPSTKP